MAEGPGTPRGKGASGGNPKTPRGAKGAGGAGQSRRNGHRRRRCPSDKRSREAGFVCGRAARHDQEPGRRQCPHASRRERTPGGKPGPPQSGCAYRRRDAPDATRGGRRRTARQRPDLRERRLPHHQPHDQHLQDGWRWRVPRRVPVSGRRRFPRREQDRLPRLTDPAGPSGRRGITTSVAVPGPRRAVTSGALGGRPTAARAGPPRVTGHASEDQPTGRKTGRHRATGLAGRAGPALAGRGQRRKAAIRGAEATGGAIHTVRARARLTAGARPGARPGVVVRGRMPVPGRVLMPGRIGRAAVRAARPGGRPLAGPGQARPRARVAGPRGQPGTGAATGATGASHARAAGAPGPEGTRHRLAVPGQGMRPGRSSRNRSAPSSSTPKREPSSIACRTTWPTAWPVTS